MLAHFYLCLGYINAILSRIERDAKMMMDGAVKI